VNGRGKTWGNFTVGVWWRVYRPRWHSFQHILMELDQGSCLNPRFAECWVEERFMGVLCKAGFMCIVEGSFLSEMPIWTC
jgi:hypothetical protein